MYYAKSFKKFKKHESDFLRPATAALNIHFRENPDDKIILASDDEDSIIIIFEKYDSKTISQNELNKLKNKTVNTPLSQPTEKASIVIDASN
jgi:hypothetical protein